ncbi:AsmA-like C-terminal region-containing protein [Myroides pelagicus]|uniref:AsmA-like C-terminal region-containing protein n=1 Tax=Myroides pelagicus TaxID=270914 RepID=UPI002DBDEDEE|nr:AsmA-like C-terminal region-containing protein [Myroides pelagicus]MEC4112894.1 AsmA-like C-terminal region-containing protein [Myroides pelagicus]
MNKRALKWIGGTLILLIAVVLLAPFMFKGKIQELVKQTINENVNATVNFKSVNLSLIRNFPKATISVNDLVVINHVPFEGDTLLQSEKLSLKMSLGQLFNGTDKPMELESIESLNTFLSVIITPDGIANYDVALKEDEEKEKDSTDSVSTPFSLALNHYRLDNLNITYSDLGSKMKFEVNELYHQGKGNFSENVLDLVTETKTRVSFVKEGDKLLNDVNLSLDAVIGIDMNQMKFVFKDNKALINQLPLEFEGMVQLVDDGQDYDLTFTTPDSDFKNFLGLVPEAYAGDLSGVKTSGEFKVEGVVKGKLTEQTIPTFGIHILAKNASFQYPDLPKGVTNIILDAQAVNKTGHVKDTYVNIDQCTFQIDKDVFHARASLKNLMENMYVKANFDGVINLENLSHAYPIKLSEPLSGLLKAKVNTNFDMQSVEKGRYQNIKNEGSLSLTGFNYANEAMPKPIKIQEAGLTFNTSNVTLNTFVLKTGETDVIASGRLDNLYGFLFNKQVLKGNFQVNSNNFVLADLMATGGDNPAVEETSKSSNSKEKEALKIPSFLDCTIHANAKKVIYDNLVLSNVKGNLVVKDESANLQNMSTEVFNGVLAFDGSVSTKEAIPTFDMNLGLKKVDITKTFTDIEFLKAVAPIAGVIAGKIDGDVKVRGQLDAIELTPAINTLSGDVQGTLLDTNITPQQSVLLSELDKKVSFIDLKKLDINNKRIHLVFKEGKVQFKPFDLKLNDMSVQVSGEHGFDQSMNYALDFKVPAKLLGSDVAGALTKLGGKDAEKYNAIPVRVDLSGNFKAPKVGTNMNEVVTNLTNQIIEDQTSQLLDKGKGALMDLLGGNKKTDEGDEQVSGDEAKSEATDKVVNKIEEGLQGLFGKKKTPEEKK